MILTHQARRVYSGQTLRELYPTPTDWPGADDTFIEKRIGYLPKWIKGISSQALDDFKCVLFDFQQNGIVLGVTGDIWFEFFYHGSHSDTDKVRLDDLVDILKRYGLTGDQFNELVDILSEKLIGEQKNRILTFFRGVCKGATSKQVKAALDYLYGFS